MAALLFLKCDQNKRFFSFYFQFSKFLFQFFQYWLSEVCFKWNYGFQCELICHFYQIRFYQWCFKKIGWSWHFVMTGKRDLNPIPLQDPPERRMRNFVRNSDKVIQTHIKEYFWKMGNRIRFSESFMYIKLNTREHGNNFLWPCYKLDGGNKLATSKLVRQDYCMQFVITRHHLPVSWVRCLLLAS